MQQNNLINGVVKPALITHVVKNIECYLISDPATYNMSKVKLVWSCQISWTPRYFYNTVCSFWSSYPNELYVK